MSRVGFALGVPVAMAADLALFAVLRRTRPRPLGISSPSVTPALLSSASWESGTRRVSNVVLCYGRPLGVAGQLLEVETWIAEQEGLLPTLEEMPTLEETITRAELRDEAWARHDWTGETSLFLSDLPVEVPAEGFERDEHVVVVAGLERRVPVIAHGRWEALRFVHDSMVVTAVARLGFRESPRFDVVDDLEPYMAEHRRFILSLLWRGFWEK